ncbi:MAG: cobalt transporter [Acidiferrobacteraceae bacterium]|nr:cobalt transporter [Acidiferrobacteraceae bacterium]|tara:strand:- start:13939 stop:14664 length:726 start_codon:yes stop_codon:yes gene_type:complete
MKLFNSIVITTLLAGLLAGLVTAGSQYLTTTPLIIQAETYEGGGHDHSSHATEEDTESHEGHDHDHSETAWSPGEGFERFFYTSVTTIATAFGFAVVMLVAMIFTKENITTRRGLAWGAAGFVATGLAPALGLSPELPGSAAAAIEARQIWWTGTVVATSIGLWLSIKISSPLALIGGILLILLPHIIGAPQPQQLTSLVPGELTAHFVSASLVTHAVMWSLVGTLTGYFWTRFGISKDVV